MQARIEGVRKRVGGLEGELRAAEAELETFSAQRLRFDLLREACNVLDRLDALQAGRLFWGEIPQVKDPPAHMAQMRIRIEGFDGEIGGALEKQARLKAGIAEGLDELDYLHDEVQDAHSRDERREEEFLVDREVSRLPEREPVMPWSHDGEVERRYRRAMSSALFLSLLLSIVVRLVTLPEPVRPVIAEVPERLAMMVREQPKPAPVPKAQQKKEEQAKSEEKKAQKQEADRQAAAGEKPAQERPQVAALEQAAAPRKSQNTGVLAFKDSFRDLIDDTPVPKLGAESRLNSPNADASGEAASSRSLVSMAGGGGGGYSALSRNAGNGGSGGIGTDALNRSVGGGGKDRIRGGAGFALVKSGIPGSGGGKEGRPLSSGARPARTDEEIQILFDRYKSALYRIYNTELRKDPTLRGKMVLRIAIEPSGAVSACAVDSTNMDGAAGFCDQIVERVKKFNFGPKEGVPKTTILYPIDFLPAR